MVCYFCYFFLSPRSLNTTSSNPPGAVVPNPIVAVFSEYTGCPQHRGLLLRLCTVLHNICLQCPTALVWNNIGEGKSPSFLNGSPLDYLPCATSALPMPPGTENAEVRNCLPAQNQHSHTTCCLQYLTVYSSAVMLNYAQCGDTCCKPLDNAALLCLRCCPVSRIVVINYPHFWAL